jgi:hypothetical protein
MHSLLRELMFIWIGRLSTIVQTIDKPSSEASDRKTVILDAPMLNLAAAMPCRLSLVVYALLHTLLCTMEMAFVDNKSNEEVKVKQFDMQRALHDLSV